MTTEKKLATVMTLRDGEIQKRPYPIRIVREDSGQWWFFGMLVGFVLGSLLAMSIPIAR